MDRAADTGAGPTPSLRNRLVSLIAVGELGVIAALIVLVSFFYILEPAFLSARNIRAILQVVSFVGIIAIGQTLLLVNGDCDLSVGSVAGLAAVCSAKLMTAAALPVPLAILGGLAVGAGAGLVNGLVVVKLRIPAFIQTLGMLFIGQGLIQVVTNGAPVYPLPPVVSAVGQTHIVFGLGWSFVFFVAAALSADFILRRTVLAATCMPRAATRRSRASWASTPTGTRSAASSSSAPSPPSPACSSWPTSRAAQRRSGPAGNSR